MARTSFAAAEPTTVTVQQWTRPRPLSMSVRHSTESEWRGMRAVVYCWRVSCTSQHQQRQALERQSLGLSYIKVLTIEHSVCRAASSPITDNISSSRSLALAAAAAASAEQQYQKPQPHDQNRQKNAREMRTNQVTPRPCWSLHAFRMRAEQFCLSEKSPAKKNSSCN